MTKKAYEWQEGADLRPHSAKKLQILRDYFSEYLRVRCVHPQAGLFRLAVVDGFAGGGRYAAGEAGSPIVFIETLANVTAELNTYRQMNGMKPLIVECKLILNDADLDTVQLLKGHVQQALAAASIVREVKVVPIFMNAPFETAYGDIKKLLQIDRYHNVIFNIDPCGNSLVNRSTIADAMQSFKGGEVFFTFMIKSLIAFLDKTNPEMLARKLQVVDVDPRRLEELSNSQLSREEWLGAAERIVYDALVETAPFVSPFSISNPDGWRYWLLHFAHVPRARQVYNDVLHQNKSSQAHFGRSGLEMLSYSPNDEQSRLYLFDDDGRASSRDQLSEDIPRFVARLGDAISISDFQYSIYNLTPAHSADIHQAIFENPDLEVLTKNGGERRKAHTYSGDDVLRLKRQPSFHMLLNRSGKTKR